MDALTPEGWLFVHESRATATGRAGVTAHEHLPVPFRSPCFMRSNLPTIPSPTTLRRPCAMIWFSDHRAYRRDTLSGVRTDRQRRQLGFATGAEARHDVWPNRVRCLRTGRSPPVALHPASQPRSYIRLQSSDPTLAGTFTLRIRSTYRRTPHPPCADGEHDGAASDATKAVTDPIRLVRMVKEIDRYGRSAHIADESPHPRDEHVGVGKRCV